MIDELDFLKTCFFICYISMNLCLIDDNESHGCGYLGFTVKLPFWGALDDLDANLRNIYGLCIMHYFSEFYVYLMISG